MAGGASSARMAAAASAAMVPLTARQASSGAAAATAARLSAAGRASLSTYSHAHRGSANSAHSVFQTGGAAAPAAAAASRGFHVSAIQMVETVKVPQMAESISEGTLKQWNKKKGDFVNADEEVATIETDKVGTQAQDWFEACPAVPSRVSDELYTLFTFLWRRYLDRRLGKRATVRYHRRDPCERRGQCHCWAGPLQA